jgi:hypothetical protein
MIILFSFPGDLTMRRVSKLLAARQVDFLELDTADLQRSWRLTLELGSSERTYSMLRGDGWSVRLADIRSVWLRRPAPPKAPGSIEEPLLRRYVEAEARELIAALWLLLECRWLPASPSLVAAAQYKLPQLIRAKELGFTIPPTLLPDCAEQVVAFHEQHRGRVVSKLLGPTAFGETMGSIFSRYTELVTRRDLHASDTIALSPALFQKYTEKGSELRITIVGDRVFAAEIDSQRTNHTRVDWRRYDHHRQIYRPHALPESVQRCCLELMRSLGLCYSAIDMILTPDGRYVFLELNPAGEFGWIEDQVGFPISEAIADLLIMNDAGENRCKPLEAPTSPL